MPGDYWRKFAQLRLLLGYLMTHPGKKLLFMGGEFGQFDEWKDLEDLDWELHDFEMHRILNDYFKKLMQLYKDSKALWELDHSYEGFEWIDADNKDQSIFSFIRKGKRKTLLLSCVILQRSFMNITKLGYHLTLFTMKYLIVIVFNLVVLVRSIIRKSNRLKSRFTTSHVISK